MLFLRFGGWILHRHDAFHSAAIMTGEGADVFVGAFHKRRGERNGVALPRAEELGVGDDVGLFLPDRCSLSWHESSPPP